MPALRSVRNLELDVYIYYRCIENISEFPEKILEIKVGGRKLS